MRILLALFGFIVAVTVSPDVRGQTQEWEFKGFQFGLTPFYEWCNSVEEFDINTRGHFYSLLGGCPFSVKDYSIYEGKKRVAPSCKATNDIGVKKCSWYQEDNLVVGRAVSKSDSWYFLDGILESFQATIDQNDIDELILGITKKYGEPKAVSYGKEKCGVVEVIGLKKETITVMISVENYIWDSQPPRTRITAKKILEVFPDSYMKVCWDSIISISNPALSESRRQREDRRRQLEDISRGKGKSGL